MTVVEALSVIRVVKEVTVFAPKAGVEIGPVIATELLKNAA